MKLTEMHVQISAHLYIVFEVFMAILIWILSLFPYIYKYRQKFTFFLSPTLTFAKCEQKSMKIIPGMLYTGRKAEKKLYNILWKLFFWKEGLTHGP